MPGRISDERRSSRLAVYLPGFVDWHPLHTALVAEGRRWPSEARETAEQAELGLEVRTAEVNAGAVLTSV